MDTYFGMLGGKFIGTVLKGLFEKSTLEQTLSFDLRNEAEDSALNQREFLRTVQTIINPLLDQSVLELIPSKIRQVASYISEVGKAHNFPNTESLIAGFFIR